MAGMTRLIDNRNPVQLYSSLFPVYTASIDMLINKGWSAGVSNLNGIDYRRASNNEHT